MGYDVLYTMDADEIDNRDVIQYTNEYGEEDVLHVSSVSIVGEEVVVAGISELLGGHDTVTFHPDDEVEYLGETNLL